MKHLPWLVFFVLNLFSSSVLALRCDRKLIEIGDYKEDVYEWCGEPDSINTHTEIVGTQGFGDATRNYGNPSGFYPNSSMQYGLSNFRGIEVVVEEWVYDFGRSRLRQHLRFENGQLKEIRNLGRGR